MRLAGLRSSLFLVVVIAIAGAVSGCDNPFDPLKSSSKIEGLTYFDFAATQEHWDSDPEWDGIQISMKYYNEFSDALNFHDKSHKVQIEFWTQKDSATVPPVPERDSFITSKTVEFSNSDDFIRIPIEYYGGFLALPSTEAITGCLLVTVFPPQEYPEPELLFLQCKVPLFKPEDALLTPP